MSNIDVKLKNTTGDYLYPLAHKDAAGNIINDTYVKKTGADSYLYSAAIEDVVESGVQKRYLVLTNKNNPSAPLRVDVTGADLSAIIAMIQALPTIFRGTTPPTSTSEHTLTFGDLWLCTDTTSATYTYNCYYRYDPQQASPWVETTNPTVSIPLGILKTVVDTTTSGTTVVKTTAGDTSKVTLQSSSATMSSPATTVSGTNSATISAPAVNITGTTSTTVKAPTITVGEGSNAIVTNGNSVRINNTSTTIMSNQIQIGAGEAPHLMINGYGAYYTNSSGVERELGVAVFG